MNTGIPEIDNARATCIVGSDECGYGSLAGPLVVCAVATPCDWPGEPDVMDSKDLKSRLRREAVYERHFKPDGFPMNLVVVEPEEIDAKGVRNALKEAHRKAVEGTFWRLAYPPIIVVDGNMDCGIEGAHYLPKADSLVPAVSLASIIGKVTHDRIMVELDKKYPGYGFAQHVGYDTPQHREALNRLGPCPVHRRSYSPVRHAAEAHSVAPTPWDPDSWT